MGLFTNLALEHGVILVILALVVGVYMAWSIGANDVANAMGTSVGSGALTLKHAVIIAAVMEVAGAVLLGSHVTNTVRGGMFDPLLFEAFPLALAFLSALFAAAVWLQLATYFGWPVSTTHSIVGALVGVGVVIGDPSVIHWGKIAAIVGSWVTSPICGGILAFGVFRLIQWRIIDRKHPLREAYRWIPALVFYVGFTMTLVVVYKGLHNLGLHLNMAQALPLSIAVGLVFAGIAVWRVRILRAAHERERVERGIELTGDQDEGIPFVRKDAPEGQVELRPALVEGSQLPAKRWEYRRHFEFEKVESIFCGLLVLSACFLAFAHGANDVANAIAPLAAVLELVHTGTVALQSQVPLWILLLGGGGIVFGLATWGYRVIETIGRKITQLTPSRGFAANIAAATTIVLASRLGFPISTTHTLVGAVFGIGLARGIESLNLQLIRDIIISWIVTIPAGASLAGLTYVVLHLLFR
jgi:inorganic phosphate transporter, PiT family